MTGTFTVSGPNVIVDFSYTASIQRVTDTVDNAVHLLYDRGMGKHSVDYSSLTNQQKLDILDAYILQSVQGLANAYYAQNAVNTAATQAATDGKTKFIP